ncbi:MAG: pteridine reductase [Gammaproteobacteria bacterium]|nr:pteridine reductase [Gammaproteobacteria bacterium]
MLDSPGGLTGKLALVTGAAQRIGAQISRSLHQAGMDILIHYRRSRQAAEQLAHELESARPGSVELIQTDLLEMDELERLVAWVGEARGRLDLLVNNASVFYPTPLGTVSDAQWTELIGSNLKGPFFLSQGLAPLLRAGHGAIINLVDIHGDRPKARYPVYSIAKAGNAMMVKALARELGPEIRVNGISPGAILWPDEKMSDQTRETILARTALKRTGRPEDIAAAVLYLARDARYMTGQILTIDGGRSVQQ